MTRFDVAIIGAGPAGYAAAMRAHDLGKRVVLIEKDRIGGAGLHEGALSSKTMWHLSNDYAGACRLDRGYRAGALDLSYDAVMGAVHAATTERRETLVYQLGRLSEPAANGGQVTLRRGTARFVTANALELTAHDGTTEKLEFNHAVIATGSTPRWPPGITIDGERIVSSDHIERWHDFPKSMVVVGAGVVGCEYATIFANFGRTKIHMIDRAPRILPFEDPDVAELIAGNYERMGIVVHRESKLESLVNKGDHVEFVVSSARGTETFQVERALISIGRVPNTATLGLEQIGVTVDKGGGIVVEATRSSVPNIYAVGDTTADLALVNVAELEGRHAIEKVAGLAPPPLRYQALSSIMFLSPEVASVGLNELQCKDKGIPYRVAVLSNHLITRAIAMRSTNGFMKLLCEPGSPGKVLGLRVVGPQASSCIQGLAFLIDQGLSIEDIDTCVHPHPAITEGVQECARLLLGRSLHKPSVFGPELVRVAAG